MPDKFPAQFPTTKWSLIAKIRSSNTEDACYALDQICQNYWMPLYQFLRIQGDSPEESEDYVQGFFLHILSKNGLATVEPPEAEG